MFLRQKCGTLCVVIARGDVLRAFFMTASAMMLSFFMLGRVTYLSEYQRNNYLCLLPSAAGIDAYVTE